MLVSNELNNQNNFGMKSFKFIKSRKVKQSYTTQQFRQEEF